MTATILPIKPGGSATHLRKGDGTYRVQGEVFTSVTHALNQIAKQEFLMPWAAEAAVKAVWDNPDIDLHSAKNAWRKVRSQAGDRGSSLHSLYEAWGRGVDVTTLQPPTALQGHWKAFLKWVAQAKPEPLLVEATVFNRTYGYAGTGDFWAIVGDTIYLIDYKTGFVDLFSCGMQLEAYARGEAILTHEEEVRPALAVEGVGVLQTRNDGTFTFYDLTDGQGAAWKDFLAYLHIANKRDERPCREACWCGGVS